jgi:hypothetical protein
MRSIGSPRLPHYLSVCPVISTKMTRSSRLPLRSDSGGLQSGSRRSRSNSNNYALSDSRSVAVGPSRRLPRPDPAQEDGSISSGDAGPSRSAGA